jgi:peptidoglycan lytic transglycosylase G
VNRILIAAAAVLIITVSAIAFGVLKMNQFLSTPLAVDGDGTPFEIEIGTAFGVVSRRLEADGIVSSGDMLRWYARWSDKAASVQAGEYLIAPGTTPAQLLTQFTSGNVRLYSFTIIEGWNHRELLTALHAHSQISAMMTEEDWPALLSELGADTHYPEGLFLPETYRFAKGTSDRSLLMQAYGLMQTALMEEWEERDATSPVKSAYEALILASIVEKETARADEREKIAGVFARRLNKRMRLQTDPTVIYGIGPDFNGNLTRRDLQTDTPYNTYTRHGLPPTPIALPGRAAIRAALHPATGEELYFVATGLGDGSHEFSSSKDEHDAAVREYLRRLRKRGR